MTTNKADLIETFLAALAPAPVLRVFAEYPVGGGSIIIHWNPEVAVEIGQVSAVSWRGEFKIDELKAAIVEEHRKQNSAPGALADRLKQARAADQESDRLP